MPSVTPVKRIRLLHPSINGDHRNCPQPKKSVPWVNTSDDEQEKKRKTPLKIIANGAQTRSMGGSSSNASQKSLSKRGKTLEMASSLHEQRKQLPIAKGV